MNYQQFVDNLDSETIDKLRAAVETGYWGNGDKLSEKQLEDSLQAVMLWQAKNEVIAESEPFKVNSKGEFRVGKGAKLSDTPMEHKTTLTENLIFRSQG
jgi:uncharacterized protein YeaC (DUF1315 family)